MQFSIEILTFVSQRLKKATAKNSLIIRKQWIRQKIINGTLH